MRFEKMFCVVCSAMKKRNAKFSSFAILIEAEHFLYVIHLHLIYTTSRKSVNAYIYIKREHQNN